nr:hypothetical protein [Tanacetum cinerariifolium]
MIHYLVVIDIKSTYKAKIEKLESRVERLEDENRVLKELKGVHSTIDSDELVMEKKESSKQGKKIADIDADVEINLEKVQAEAYNLDLDHQENVLSMLDVNDEEPAGVEEVLEVVKAAKLITEVVTTAGVDVNAASFQDTPITAAEATKGIVEVPKPRKRRGVIIQDPEETTTTVTVQPKVQAKDKGKAILIEEPKPLKRQVKINLDEEVARQLEAELNANINWNAVIEQVNEGIKVLEKEVRQEKEVEVESSKREGESLEQEIAKKQKMEQETGELKKHLQIVPVDDDDVTMIKNFEREDLESLWKIVRERFEKTEPKNFSDDYLLNTLKIMFEKPNVEANAWKDKKGNMV